MKARLLGAMCATIFSFISIPSHAALVDNGGGLIYDDVLDITWAQPDAQRIWDDANTWAAGLTLGGVSGWRLPYISVAAGCRVRLLEAPSTAARPRKLPAAIMNWDICFIKILGEHTANQS